MVLPRPRAANQKVIYFNISTMKNIKVIAKTTPLVIVRNDAKVVNFDNPGRRRNPFASSEMKYLFRELQLVNGKRS